MDVSWKDILGTYIILQAVIHICIPLVFFFVIPLIGLLQRKLGCYQTVVAGRLNSGRLGEAVISRTWWDIWALGCQ